MLWPKMKFLFMRPELVLYDLHAAMHIPGMKQAKSNSVHQAHCRVSTPTGKTCLIPNARQTAVVAFIATFARAKSARRVFIAAARMLHVDLIEFCHPVVNPQTTL